MNIEHTYYEKTFIVQNVMHKLLLLFFFRITPNEWQNPHPCASEPEELENSLSLINCLWFSLGSILCQGSEVLPR